MVRSIRARLQIWYAMVLVVVIGGFAGVLYYQVRTDRLQRIDARLEAAVRYLEATVRSLPPHELIDGPPSAGDGPPPPERPPFRRLAPSPGRRPQPDDRPERFGGRPREGDFEGPLDGPEGNFGGPPNGPPVRRPRVTIELPGSLLDQPREEPEDWPYFVIWRAKGSVLASSSGRVVGQRPAELAYSTSAPPGFRFQPRGRREAFLTGPAGTLILVGKPIARELNELQTFAWQTFGSGALVLAVGLFGGWVISRSITRPIAEISRTASAISASNLSGRIHTPGIDLELLGLANILNEMFTRLEAAFLRQSRFTSDASHELRTPLAIIHSNVELALSKPRSVDEYRQTLTACLRASSRMASLVDGLLTLARADAGRLDLLFKPLDLRHIVEEVIDQYGPLAEDAKVSLSVAVCESAIVTGDAVFLARILGNLLSNAIRHTAAGGQVQVSLRAHPEFTAMSVQDTGCGIPLEDQPQVFERFFRADKARSRALGGNGLGLAICKCLVEAHLGTISFASIPDRVTRFEIRLPLAHRINSVAASLEIAHDSHIEPQRSAPSPFLENRS